MNIQKRKKILIADDDPAICDALMFMLEEEGYETSSTVNGSTIYAMEDSLPDLLLLDIWMSGHDGREICKYVKKNEKTRHIPVIILSASRDIEQSAAEAGADDFIPKPFDMDEILQKIALYTKN